MKRIILAIALLWCTVAISAPDAMAKAKPHKKHRAHITTALHPNIVKPFPRPEDEASLMTTDSSCDDQCLVSDMSALIRTSNTAYMCPSLDTAACNVPASFGLTTTQTVTPIASADQSINNYYYAKAVYEPPTTVTVGGFSVPVKGNPLYFSPFKHRDGAPLPVHNSKGVDETAGVGVSPRADGFPESIGSWPTYVNTPPSR
jgi:hypothetical protein